MDYTYEQRVANSIKLLDDNVGKFDWLTADWHSKIDLDKLDMYSVKNCVLGQLEGDYDKACDAFENIGIVTSGSKYIFHTATSEWIKALKASASKFQVGQVWYNSNGDSRKVISVGKDDSNDLWITYTYALGGLAGVNSAKEEGFADYSLTAPKRFNKGDELISKNGDVFYYISDDKVIRATNKGLTWAGLDWFEKDFGPFTKLPCPTTEFFFDGKFFWNN